MEVWYCQGEISKRIWATVRGWFFFLFSFDATLFSWEDWALSFRILTVRNYVCRKSSARRKIELSIRVRDISRDMYTFDFFSPLPCIIFFKCIFMDFFFCRMIPKSFGNYWEKWLRIVEKIFWFLLNWNFVCVSLLLLLFNKLVG